MAFIKEPTGLLAANSEVKQILKQLLRNIPQHRFTNQSGKVLTVTVSKEDFWKLFSDWNKQTENTKLHYHWPLICL